jgi:WD40 repeat protein
LLVQLPTREIAVPRVFSPDGKRLVTTSGSLVQVFDVATGARLFPSNKPRILPTRYYALSADGKRLAALYHPPRCVLWDVSTSEVVREWTPANYVGRVAFSPNEDYVAVGRNGVELFAVNDDAANPLVFPPKRAAAPYLAVTSPDGAAMAEVEPSGLIRIRSFVTPPDRARQTTLALTGHVGGVTALAFSLDGDHLASCGADNTICIWSMETGKRVHKIQLARPARRCVALSPDASRVATAVGDRLQVWSTAAGELETGMVVEGEPRCIEFSPDGKWLTSASDTGELRVFNAADGKLVAHALASEQPVTVMRYSADGESILVGRQDGAVEVWNAADLKQKARWTDLKSRVRSIALLAGSSRMAAGDAAGSVAVWDLNNHQRLNHATRIGVGMRHLAFSADGMQLRCCSNRTYASVDLATNKRAGAIVGVSSTGEKRPLDYAFAPDGKTLATALPSALELWEIESGQRVEILPTPEDCSATLAFSPHGDILAAARQGIIIWRPAGDAEPIFINKSACGETLSLTFSPDGRVLASGGREKAVKLWDTTTGSLLHTLPVKRENHDGQLAFTADGRVLLGYDRDFDQPKGRQTYLMMWETATGRLLAEHNIPMDVYAFDRHGRRLITTAENGAYLVRNLEPYHHQALRPAADDPIQLEALWSRLAEEDPQVAYRAIGALAARGTEAIELINDRLRPIAEAKETQAADITALVEQVATGDLADRRKASSKLRRLGPAAFPELRRTLNTKDDLSAAARGRIEILLAAQRPDRSSEQLRTIRAIHVLERIGSQQARHVLKKLAAGAKDAFRTEQARQVLSRLP